MGQRALRARCSLHRGGPLPKCFRFTVSSRTARLDVRDSDPVQKLRGSRDTQFTCCVNVNVKLCDFELGSPFWGITVHRPRRRAPLSLPRVHSSYMWVSPQPALSLFLAFLRTPSACVSFRESFSGLRLHVSHFESPSQHLAPAVNAVYVWFDS